VRSETLKEAFVVGDHDKLEVCLPTAFADDPSKGTFSATVITFPSSRSLGQRFSKGIDILLVQIGCWPMLIKIKCEIDLKAYSSRASTPQP